jgi:AraC-like DNA-binding protein
LYLTELVTFIVWYVRATKAYHRFLADNYADLEHKELVWSWMILSSIFLSTINYLLTMFQSDMHTIVVCTYAIHVADTIFIFLIVWHIDRQHVLEPLAEESAEEVQKSQDTTSQEAPALRKDIIIYKTGELLRKHCEETQLYLQHDLSLKTLALACHTNRTYLSLYFASQGITYYIYINKLRIDHFQSLYREAMKEKSTIFTLQQLSKDSGFVSYNTFSRAFVSCTGISVSKWQEQVNLEG